jgi:hypothetical protein
MLLLFYVVIYEYESNTITTSILATNDVKFNDVFPNYRLRKDAVQSACFRKPPLARIREIHHNRGAANANCFTSQQVLWVINDILVNWVIRR